MKVFNKFEQDVMNEILHEKPELAKDLAKQYETSQVVRREFTGVGFFTYFKVSDTSLKLKDDLNISFGKVQVHIPN